MSVTLKATIPAGGLIAPERLLLSSDGTVVQEGDKRGVRLICAKGVRVPERWVDLVAAYLDGKGKKEDPVTVTETAPFSDRLTRPGPDLKKRRGRPRKPSTDD